MVDKTIDDVIGFVHVRDLYQAIAADPTRPVSEILRPIPYLPATARVLPTLTMMRAEGHQIAVIVDEYGGTDGIVTLEDLVEEVVGEIFDEYDTDSARATSRRTAARSTAASTSRTSRRRRASSCPTPHRTRSRASSSRTSAGSRRSATRSRSTA
ncbi:Hemolysin C [Clavibacter michiganensis subsp. michiganensis]|uniref:Hemolysin C n=1 Tax=Clavibacter michiganensis subsp. michiganensis TaxID=33013 RepID=A0A251XDG0_CLAMM|nr:Hemolysin C [Clavibacter michiganensis subsp. michiganensis]OUE00231.1 Hemolysin C [Clavibacter michiganensis subsp. michiganensis]